MIMQNVFKANQLINIKMKYFDYENQEKGYKPFQLDKKSIEENIGKRIVYVTNRDVDTNRGYVFPQYGRLYAKKRNEVWLNEGEKSINVRDVLECGIEI